MQRLHDALPDHDSGVRAEIHGLGIVVAGPDRRYIVGREADEIAVIVVRGRARLAGDGHAGEVSSGAGAAAADRVFEHVADVGRRVGREGADRARDVVQHNVAVGVEHLRVGPAVGHRAGVDEGAVSLRHLADGRALGQRAERHGRVIGVGGQERREAQLLRQVLVALRRGELIHDLRRDRVL